MRDAMRDNPGRIGFTELGTAATIDLTQAFGGLPTRNFLAGAFEGVDNEGGVFESVLPASARVTAEHRAGEIGLRRRERQVVEPAPGVPVVDRRPLALQPGREHDTAAPRRCGRTPPTCRW